MYWCLHDVQRLLLWAKSNRVPPDVFYQISRKESAFYRTGVLHMRFPRVITVRVDLRLIPERIKSLMSVNMNVVGRTYS